MFITFFFVFLVHFLNSHNVFMLQKNFCNVLHFNILNEIPASNIAKHESCEQAFSDNNIYKKQIAAIEALGPSAFFFPGANGTSSPAKKLYNSKKSVLNLIVILKAQFSN